jgi:hypothetical protein
MDQLFFKKRYFIQDSITCFNVAYKHCITLQSALKSLEYEGPHNSHYAHCQNVSDDHNETNVTNNLSDTASVENILSMVRMC